MENIFGMYFTLSLILVFLLDFSSINTCLSQTFTQNIQNNQTINKIPPANKPTNTEITSTKKTLELKGCIQINEDKENVPKFRIYFDGMETINNEDGFFSFPVEDKELKEYFLIMAKKIDFKIKKSNTLEYLKIVNKDHYRLFSIKKTDEEDGSLVWEEKMEKKDDFIVPIKSILVMVNPRDFKGLEAWKTKLPEKFIGIPKIILNSGCKKSLERQANKSMLYSLDLTTFHERVGNRKKNIPTKGQISLM
jgi:hypothetical protein